MAQGLGKPWVLACSIKNTKMIGQVVLINIVSFSGGKDSTALLLMMLERGMKVDYIVCVDMGKEFPEMYEHWKQVEEYTGRKLTILKLPKSYDYYMFDHVKTKGKNKGKRGYGWAQSGIRWCTTLKTQLINRFLRSLNEPYQEFVGIAADEAKRCKDKNYPLVEWGVTEAQALEYCRSKGFDWGGLYDHSHRVSCRCCPLKSIPELRVIWKYHPDVWKELQDMDNRAYNQFRADYSIADLTKRFENE